MRQEVLYSQFRFEARLNAERSLLGSTIALRYLEKKMKHKREARREEEMIFYRVI